jgi:hypothetical protein
MCSVCWQNPAIVVSSGYLVMTRNNWLNMLWMQALWFGAVMGAAKQQLWLAPVLLMGFAFWELRPSRRIYGDFQLMLVAVLIGLILDTTWVRLGWLEFAASWAFSERAPLWILLLWAGLALTLNHSLAWLQSRLVLAALLGGVSSPLSYLAAARLGAVTIVTESGVWLVGLGLSWAVALPLLLWLASHLKQLKQEEQADV